MLKRLFSGIALFFCFITPTFAQTGSISGVVTDKANGDTMIGVTVRVEGTSLGAVTDMDGRYQIRQVPVGAKNLLFSFVGYQNSTVRNVMVKAAEVTKVDFAIAEEVYNNNEVVIEAKAITDSEGALLRNRQKSVAVSDAISAEAISKSGSSSAADAMTKVTGASVVGGKYVYVRGLGERYSSTHLNGIELPSADPDKKAFNFDLFSSDLLDNITTLKTFTPDKPGNFSGGLVDIGTRSFPEKRTISLNFSSGINSVTNFNNQFLSYQGGKMDWIGRDDGTRQIPTFLNQTNLELPSIVEARRNSEKAQMLDEASKALTSPMSPVYGAAPVKSGMSFALGNQIKIAKRPLGYLFSVNYDYSGSHRAGASSRYINPTVGATELYSTLNFYQDQKSTTEASLGGLVNLAYTISPMHQISFNGLYSRSGESMARYQEGYWYHSFGDDESRVLQNRVLGYTERNLTSLQLRGKHVFPTLLGSTVEWSLAGAETKQDEPDLRFFVSLRSEEEQGVYSYSTNLANVLFPSHYWRALNEGSRNANLDITVPFKQWNNQKASVKFGGTFAKSNRTFTEKTFLIRPTNNYDNNPNDYFGESNSGIVNTQTLVNGTKFYQFGNIVELPRKEAVLRNNYNGNQTVAAGYAMTELPITTALRLIGGVRYEATDMQVVSADPALAPSVLKNQDLLPSANLVYQLKDDMNLRAAFTKTLARPVFREISRFSASDFLLGGFLAGNPDLKRTLITNYDLRWEWFTRPGEIIAVSGFYKDMQNPIERSIYEAGATESMQFVNVPQAKILGAEFEFRKRLDRLGASFDKWSLGANVSLVKSTIDLPEAEYLSRKALDPNAITTRPLQGQSPFLVNTDISYNSAKTNAGLYFNVFGDRLTAVSFGNTPDVYERPSPKLDFVASHNFGSLKVKLSAKNLLDSKYRESYNFLDKDYNYYEYNTGRTLSLSVGYNF